MRCAFDGSPSPSAHPNEFPARLKRIREAKHESRKICSELCGLDKNAIGRYERGERSPNLRALLAIAEHFGVSVDYLVGRSDKRK